MACDRNGVVRVWSWDAGLEASEAIPEPLTSFETGGDSSVARFHGSSSVHLAVGGREKDLVVWDVATGAHVPRA